MGVFVPRSHWGSVTELGPDKIRKPVDLVFLHHSVTPTTDDPCLDMRLVEKVGIERFGKLSYSYGVHHSGVVLEGQADFVGAHTSGFNHTAIGVVFIGNNLEGQLPGAAAIQGAIDIINACRAFGVTTRNPRVIEHKVVRATACPGLTAAEVAQIRAGVGGRA